MKKENYYTTLYEIRLSEFNLKREQKVKNLQEHEQQVLNKIKSLQADLQSTRTMITKLSDEKFPSFEDFFRKLSEQAEANKKRTQIH